MPPGQQTAALVNLALLGLPKRRGFTGISRSRLAEILREVTGFLCGISPQALHYWHHHYGEVRKRWTKESTLVRRALQDGQRPVSPRVFVRSDKEFVSSASETLASLRTVLSRV